MLLKPGFEKNSKSHQAYPLNSNEGAGELRLETDIEQLSFKSCFSKEQGLDLIQVNSFMNMSLELGDLISSNDIFSENHTNALAISQQPTELSNSRKQLLKLSIKQKSNGNGIESHFVTSNN